MAHANEANNQAGDEAFLQLLGLRAAVHPDGQDCHLTLHTTAGPISLTVNFDCISALHAEIRHASLLMLYRRTHPVALVADPVQDLLRTAQRPSRISVLRDNSSSDWVFLQEFQDRMPFVIRMSSEELSSTLASIAHLSRTRAH